MPGRKGRFGRFAKDGGALLVVALLAVAAKFFLEAFGWVEAAVAGSFLYVAYLALAHVRFGAVVTRALAVAMVAVLIGAAHSWWHPVQLDLEAAAGDEAAVEAQDRPDAPPVARDNGGPAPPEQVPEQVPERTPDPEPTPEPVQPEQSKLPSNAISLAEARQHWLNATADFIDARDEAAFLDGRVTGAYNLSLRTLREGGAKLFDVLQYLEPDRMIIIYCSGADCAESRDVGIYLQRSRYRNIRIMVDGYPGWRDAGYDIELGPSR
jgi:rhodanese-related sulfurtransferase